MTGTPVLLARHGETDDNRPPGRFQGWRDTPLNDTGRAQARALAERLAAHEPPIAEIWSSDLSRARETAGFVADRLGLPVRTDPRLREGSRGRWEGFLFEEIRHTDPAEFARWRAADPAFSFPGGESLPEHQARVCECVEEIRAGTTGLPLAVCHGGSIRVMLALADPRGLAAFWSYEVPNTAVVEV